MRSQRKWKITVTWLRCFFFTTIFTVYTPPRVTQAMEGVISDHVWTIEELCGLLPEMASATKRIDKELILKTLGEQAS
jgi:hypothetical protein